MKDDVMKEIIPIILNLVLVIGRSTWIREGYKYLRNLENMWRLGALLPIQIAQFSKVRDKV